MQTSRARTRFWRAEYVTVLTGLALCAWAGAATIYVAPGGDDSRSGLDDWANAVLTISNGVAQAINTDDLVLVSNGVYALTETVTVSLPITVRSWNNGSVDSTNTIVNGQDTVGCLSMTHTSAVVEGLTFYNGNAGAGDGGGVIMSGGTLRNCIVVSNTANGSGGGYTPPKDWWTIASWPIIKVPAGAGECASMALS